MILMLFASYLLYS